MRQYLKDRIGGNVRVLLDFDADAVARAQEARESRED